MDHRTGNAPDRTLEILADGQPVTGWRHARLTGREELSLAPSPFFLRIRNLAESDFLLLSRAGEVSVSHDGSVLAAGPVTDCFRRADREGTLTTVTLAPGLPLWEARVSLSVEAGVPVSETVRRLLEASGTGIRLLGWTGRDPVLSRGQAFLGRAAECVTEALSAASARACTVASGLCAVPEEGPPPTLFLSEKDLNIAPSSPAKGLLVLRTDAVGWTAGKGVSVSREGLEAEGTIIARSVDADTGDGPWMCELLLEVSPQRKA